MTKSHTPWELNKIGYFWSIKSGIWHVTSLDKDCSDEDAAYIVKAVNLHQQLVDELDWLTSHVSESMEGGSIIPNPKYPAHYEKARELVALAKSGAV